MSNPHAQILTGLSLSIAGVVLVAVLDEVRREARIEQLGEPLNWRCRRDRCGEGAACGAGEEGKAGFDGDVNRAGEWASVIGFPRVERSNKDGPRDGPPRKQRHDDTILGAGHGEQVQG